MADNEQSLQKQQRRVEYSRRIDSGLFGVSVSRVAANMGRADIARQLNDVVSPKKVKLVRHGDASNGDPYYQVKWDNDCQA